MQIMKNATKQLNTSMGHRRRADNLSAAARRPSNIVGGAHELSAAKTERYKVTHREKTES